MASPGNVAKLAAALKARIGQVESAVKQPRPASVTQMVSQLNQRISQVRVALKDRSVPRFEDPVKSGSGYGRVPDEIRASAIKQLEAALIKEWARWTVSEELIRKYPKTKNDTLLERRFSGYSACSMGPFYLRPYLRHLRRAVSGITEACAKWGDFSLLRETVLPLIGIGDRKKLAVNLPRGMTVLPKLDAALRRKVMRGFRDIESDIPAWFAHGESLGDGESGEACVDREAFDEFREYQSELCVYQVMWRDLIVEWLIPVAVAFPDELSLETLDDYRWGTPAGRQKIAELMAGLLDTSELRYERYNRIARTTFGFLFAYSPKPYSNAKPFQSVNVPASNAQESMLNFRRLANIFHPDLVAYLRLKLAQFAGETDDATDTIWLSVLWELSKKYPRFQNVDPSRPHWPQPIVDAYNKHIGMFKVSGHRDLMFVPAGTDPQEVKQHPEKFTHRALLTKDGHVGLEKVVSMFDELGSLPKGAIDYSQTPVYEHHRLASARQTIRIKFVSG